MATNTTTTSSADLHSYFLRYNSRFPEGSLERFFIFYHDRLNQFDHLRSLDLTGIPNESFSRSIDRLVQSMPQLALTLYKIKDENAVFSDERTEHFIRFILTLQNVRQISLHKAHVILALESAVPTIEYICLESITITEMRKLKTYRPNLRFLTIKKINFNESNDKQSGTFPSNNLFVSISRNRLASKFVELETSFMKKILFMNLRIILSTLTHLSLQHSAGKTQNFGKFFDGSWWENCLKTSIPQLKSFAFEFIFGYPHKTLTFDEVKVMLIPFQTDYWLKEKRWYVNFILTSAHGPRLFTDEFQRDKCEMTDVNSLLKLSTNESLSTSQIMTELTIDYSAGDPLPSSLRFGSQVLDLYIQGPVLRAGSPSRYLSLNDHIRPYVDYCNVQRLRLAANIAFEDQKQLKTGFLRLFRNIRCMKIDRMEHLQSLLVQRKKAIHLMTNQIYLLKIVEPTNWWFWRDRRSIEDFCRVFINVKQLDLKVRDSQVMAIIIDALLNLEEAIFRFPISVNEILLANKDLCLFNTRLRCLNWSYEIFEKTVHLYKNKNEICSESEL
jgi:hypothetical protein